MSSSSNTDAQKHSMKAQVDGDLDTFPIHSIFSTPEQQQRFELLRLAFFVLKLRKLEQQVFNESEAIQQEDFACEVAFRRNLLQHAVFQQMLTLTNLNAREQAMQIITACHTHND